MHIFRQIMWVMAIATSVLTLSGCTVEKARALQAAATQFKVESNAALDAIETALRREIEQLPRSQTEADAAFVNFMTQLEFMPDDVPGGPATPGASETSASAEAAIEGGDTEDQQNRGLPELTPQIIEIAIDQFGLPSAGAIEEMQSDYVNEIRLQYSTFASIFDDLDRGYLFAAEAVQAASPYAETLTLQLAGFAKQFSDHPPKLLQHRSALAHDIEFVLKNDGLTSDQIRAELLRLKERWVAMRADEKAMQGDIILHCLKAAQIGMQVRKLIDNYDKMSLEDLQNTVARVLDMAGSITGDDFTGLKEDADKFFTTIKADPIWSDLADQAMSEINIAFASPVAASTEDVDPSDDSPNVEENATGAETNGS